MATNLKARVAALLRAAAPRAFNLRDAILDLVNPRPDGRPRCGPIPPGMASAMMDRAAAYEADRAAEAEGVGPGFDPERPPDGA